MTFAGGIGGGGNQFEAAIYYLDNPSAAGTLNVDTDFSRGITVAVMSLTGAASGHGAVNTSSGAFTSLTTTANDSLVIASTTFDEDNVSGVPTPPTATSPLSDVIGLGNEYQNDNNSHSIATGSQAVSSSNTAITPTFNEGTNTVAVEFTVIPEPSAAFLGGLGLLALLRRRR